MILVDTSVLVATLTGTGGLVPAMTRIVERGERLALCAPVLYEWLRGPRSRDDLEVQEALFPAAAAWPFGAAEATLAADLYRRLPRPRQRELDFAIAACALTRNAWLWTVTPDDFTDIPDLRLYTAP